MAGLAAYGRLVGAELLYAVEERFGHDRFVEAADRAVLATQAGHVSGVGGVAEHLADGVLGELAAAAGTRALGV